MTTVQDRAEDSRTESEQTEGVGTPVTHDVPETFGGVEFSDEEAYEAIEELQQAAAWADSEPLRDLFEDTAALVAFLMKERDEWRTAERERCARIAERDGSSHDAPYPHTPQWLHDTGLQVRTADRIAAAIRKRD